MCLSPIFKTFAKMASASSLLKSHGAQPSKFAQLLGWLVCLLGCAKALVCLLVLACAKAGIAGRRRPLPT